MPQALPIARSGTADDRISALFDTHHSRLFRLARRLTSQRADALDLVQETFLRVARRPAAIPMGSANEEAWLVRVLINIQRDRWRRSLVLQRYEAAQHPSLVAEGPEAAVLARTTVWHALESLAPRRRAVLVLHELEERSVTEIASLLGITAVTVRWHLSRARRALARVLRPQIGAIDENR